SPRRDPPAEPGRAARSPGRSATGRRSRPRLAPVGRSDGTPLRRSCERTQGRARRDPPRAVGSARSDDGRARAPGHGDQCQGARRTAGAASLDRGAGLEGLRRHRVPSARARSSEPDQEDARGRARGAVGARPARMGFTAVIFDMDGLLVDSEPLGMEDMRRVMARQGVPYTEADNNEFVGSTTLEECRILKARHRLEADARDLTRQYVDILVDLIREGPRPMPGVPDVLGALLTAGYRMALASSAEPVVIATNLDALDLGRFFEAIVSGTEVARGKPAPDVFLETAKRLGLPAPRCL